CERPPAMKGNVADPPPPKTPTFAYFHLHRTYIGRRKPTALVRERTGSAPGLASVFCRLLAFLSITPAATPPRPPALRNFFCNLSAFVSIRLKLGAHRAHKSQFTDRPSSSTASGRTKTRFYLCSETAKSSARARRRRFTVTSLKRDGPKAGA